MLAAGELAIGKRGERLARIGREQIGVVTATGAAGAEDFASFQRLVMDQGKAAGPGELLGLYRNLFSNAAAANIAIRFGLKGIGASVWGGALAGMEAVDYALRLLVQGRLKAVVVAVVELMTPLLEKLVAASSSRTAESCEFAQGEHSTVQLPGEIAVAMLFQVAGRGEEIPQGVLCSVKGMGRAAASRTGGLQAALAQAAGGALRWVPEGGVELLVRGTGQSRATAAVEQKALERVLQGEGPLPTIFPKDLVGDCYSAAGPLAVAVGALALSSGRVPPSASAVSRAAAGRPPLRKPPCGQRRPRHVLVSVLGEDQAFAMVLGAAHA